MNSDRVDQKEMPFLSHLEELRWRLIKVIIVVVVGAVVVYFFSEDLLRLLILPYREAGAFLGKVTAKELIFLAPTGAFMVRIKLSVFAGIVLGLPVILYQMWQFVAPGLLGNEKKQVPLIVFASTLCFVVGALFCYSIVLKYGLRFLLGFETEELVANISINEYLQFVTMLILVFGLIFELPVLSFFLTKVGFLTPAFLRHYRRHGIVAMVIVSALLTPPDIFTQLLLAGPLVVLYEISILVSKLTLKKSE